MCGHLIDAGFSATVFTRSREKAQALLDKGAAFGARPVGGRALLSLRVEKGYGSWSREYSPEYWPQEVGLDRLIKLDKPEFLGRDAYLAIKDKAPREKLVVVQIEQNNVLAREAFSYQRTSDTVVTITLPAFADYDITADETVTVTVPSFSQEAVLPARVAVPLKV